MKEKNPVLKKAKNKEIKLLLKEPHEFWSGIEELDVEAFHKCNALESIIVPKTVKTVSTRAFSFCSNLKKVVFEEGIQEIKTRPFYMTYNIESVVFPSSAQMIPESFCSHQRKLKKLEINEGTKSIGRGAFYFCDNLEKVSLPSSIISLEKEAFAYCSKVKEITLNEGLVKIGESCFQGNQNLRSINIPKSVEGLPRYAFADCYRLSNVTINKGIKSIGKEAFRTIGAEKIIIPGSVETIGDKAFSGCYNLREVEFENGVKELGFNVFEECHRLEKVILPSSLKQISKFNFIDSRFNYIYKTKDGKTIISKSKIDDYEIEKEYSLRRLDSFLSKCHYYSILMDNDKLDDLYRIIDKFEKASIKMPGKMFENYEDFKEFVENSNLYNYNRLLIKLSKDYDEYDITAIMKFARNLGMFEKSNVLVDYGNTRCKVSELAYTSIIESLKSGCFNKGKIFKNYAFKSLKECTYDEDLLLSYVKKLKEYRVDVANKTAKR